MKTFSVYGAIFLNLLFAAPTAAESWSVYQYPDTGFQIEFPTPPKTIERESASKLIILSRVYRATQGAVTFEVATSLGIPGWIDPVDADGIIQKTVESIRAKLECEAHRNTNLSFNRGTAREVVLNRCKATPDIITFRCYVAGDAMYILVASRSTGEDNADIDRFFSSFRVMETAPTITAWKLYQYPEDGFEMEFPGAPAIQEESSVSIFPPGLKRERHYELDHRSSAYRVEVKASSAKSFDLNNEWHFKAAGLVFNLFGGCKNMRRQDPVDFPKGRAWEVVLDCGDQEQYLVRARFYLTDSRTYLVVTSRSAKDTFRDHYLTRFLNSFRLLAAQ